MRWPGVEPGSIAWKATMLTVTPPTLYWTVPTFHTLTTSGIACIRCTNFFALYLTRENCSCLSFKYATGYLVSNVFLSGRELRTSMQSFLKSFTDLLGISSIADVSVFWGEAEAVNGGSVDTLAALESEIFCLGCIFTCKVVQSRKKLRLHGVV